MAVKGFRVQLRDQRADVGAVVRDPLVVRQQIVVDKALPEGAEAQLHPVRVAQLCLVAEDVDELLQRLYPEGQLLILLQEGVDRQIDDLVHGVPDDGGVYADTLRSLHRKVEYLFPYYRFVGEKKLLWLAKYCIKRLLHPTTDSVKTLKERMNRMVRNQLPENSPGSCEVFDDFRIIPLQSKIFFDCTDMEFEGRSFRAIRNADTYLSAMYGDYMTLPPEDQRVSHHFYIAYIAE